MNDLINARNFIVNYLINVINRVLYKDLFLRIFSLNEIFAFFEKFYRI